MFILGLIRFIHDVDRLSAAKVHIIYIIAKENIKKYSLGPMGQAICHLVKSNKTIALGKFMDE